MSRSLYYILLFVIPNKIKHVTYMHVIMILVMLRHITVKIFDGDFFTDQRPKHEISVFWKVMLGPQEVWLFNEKQKTHEQLDILFYFIIEITLIHLEFLLNRGCAYNFTWNMETHTHKHADPKQPLRQIKVFPV